MDSILIFISMFIIFLICFSKQGKRQGKRQGKEVYKIKKLNDDIFYSTLEDLEKGNLNSPQIAEEKGTNDLSWLAGKKEPPRDLNWLTGIDNGKRKEIRQTYDSWIMI